MTVVSISIGSIAWIGGDEGGDGVGVVRRFEVEVRWVG